MANSPLAIFEDLQSSLGVADLEPLAQGGQKFVLRCTRQGRPAAVKAMLVQPGPAVQYAVAWARRETGLLAAVDSVRVVRLLSEPVVLRFQGGLPYGVAWVEELLDGVDLSTLLHDPWDRAGAARLVVHLAEALAALHGSGIVHRDLSPVNVHQRADGGFVVMDLGLARFLDEGDPGDAGTFGTPGYWSPEHAPGSAGTGPAGDVFCLGILAYQALVGRLPIEPAVPAKLDEDYLERLTECVIPAVASARPDVPEALAGIVDRCLSREPEARFADGRALLDELGNHQDVFGLHLFEGQTAAGTGETAWAEPPTRLVDPAEPDRALGYHGPATGPVVIRGRFGERRVPVESIAADQEAFAVRLDPYTASIGPGLELSARTIDLGNGRFTNSYQLSVDLDQAEVGLHSDPRGFFLPDLVDGGAVAALSGSFSFISDEPDYQPAEPCLDFCNRGGSTVSLPTAVKPAFLVYRGRALLRELDARGTLRIGGREFGWIGSKIERRGPDSDDDNDNLTVFGAANCRVQYKQAPRTGVLRWAERSGNTTPPDEECVDLVVGRAPDAHPATATVTALREGGGTDLFAGSYILRGPRSLAGQVRVGDPVEVCSVDGLDCADIASGASIGPSLAATRRGGADLAAYDDSLGLSPFVPGRRHARTLIGLARGRLLLRVLDGAPMSRTFQGVTCAEALRILADDGVDAEAVFHLDGGQSSKLAVARDGTSTVLGNMHYLLWPKLGEGPFLWRGYHGRLLHSALRVTVPGSAVR